MMKNPNSPKRKKCTTPRTWSALLSDLLRSVFERLRFADSQIVTTSKTWSELPSDILISVFERLGFADFRRAKSVCSSWNSASRQYVPKKNQIPWLIFFPEKDNANNSCTLFNLEEKDKLYKVKDLSLDIAKSVCVATYGSWLLIQDPLYNLYIVNLFTKERISLPPIEWSRIKRTVDGQFLRDFENHQNQSIQSPVFWVDEITKDYVVVWGFSSWSCLLYAKKGDDLWTQIPHTSHSYNQIYKDHKLYFLRYGYLNIFDFSGEMPLQTFRESRDMDHMVLINHEVVGEKNVLTVTGDILRVARRLWYNSCTESFHVNKVCSLKDYYSINDFKKYDEIDSLGDEAILYDLGVTVLANGVEGLKRNSIYFNGLHDKNTNMMCIYNLETKEVEQLYKFDCSLVQFSNARWFLPSS